MSRLADARQALFDAFEPVLPGRVQPYPRDKTRYVAPAIWIEQAAINRALVGTRTITAIASFPVYIVMDGANHAQVAGHDDIVAQVWDACATVTRGEPQSARPTEVDIGSGNTLRATVVTAEITLEAITLCPPVPAVAQIPPVPIEEAV
jgi:hypothetical protein